MSDKFDKILSDKINDAVEHHKIPYNPKHWEQLKAKKNIKKRLGFWYWRVASVLVVMLLCSLFINYFINLNSIEENEIKQKVITEELSPNSIKDSLQNHQQYLVTENETLDSLKNSNINTVNKFQNPLKAAKNRKESNNIAANKIFKKSKQETKFLSIIEKDFENENVKEKQKVFVESNELSLAANQRDPSKNEEELISKETDSVFKKENLVKDDQTKIIESFDKRLKLGLLISSLYNIQENNASDNMMVSSGLSLEIPVSKKFELFVGAIYSNQNFNLLSQNSTLKGVVSAKGNNVMLKSRATSISAIELPLNLKYNFEFDKKQLFVSAGISSIQYFNEQIENTFVVSERSKVTGKDNLGNNFVQYELNQTENSVESSINSNRFEFLGSFNVSAGILLPISSTSQSLIIEPYFKYSLNSITSQNVNYSNIGVQFRYNFSFKK